MPVDQFDVNLDAAELLAELELTTSLIVAATGAGGTLSQNAIDQILGVAAPAPRTGD